MPVIVHADVRRMSQNEFGSVAYEVMKHVFAIHSEFGRFLCEEIYHSEIARRCGGLMKVPVDVRHRDFHKRYFIDLLIGDGAVFELKAAAKLTDRHRGQLLQYLLLTDLSHGKLINLRADLVEHEFVNTMLTLADRVKFALDEQEWANDSGARELQGAILDVLRDLGTCLHPNIYKAAVTHLLGGPASVFRKIEIYSNGVLIGLQRLRLATPSIAFTFTTAPKAEQQRVENHLQRFLNHTKLNGVHWINVRHELVTMKTIWRGHNGRSGSFSGSASN